MPLPRTPLPVLYTSRLRLRWFAGGDARFILKLLNDRDWIRYIGRRPVQDLPQARDWIAERLVPAYGRDGFGFWAMERREDGRVIGMCGLVQRDALPHPDIGYALLPRFRGHGYVREAASATLDYARDVLGLEELWAITSPENEASARVLLGIGMVDRGVRRVSQEWGDSRVFTWTDPRPPETDAARIDALVARFFRAFGQAPADAPQPGTLPALPHYFIPNALVSTPAPDGTARITDVHGFIAPRAELLLQGRLAGFREWEVDARTDLVGPVAQRWVRYAKEGVLDARPFEGRGTKTLQLVRTPRGWKIAALAWADDLATPFVADESSPRRLAANG